MEFSPLPPLQTPHTHKSISTPAVLKCRRSSGRLSWSRCQRGLWNPCCACYFSWLPDDILIEDIFGFLSIADRIRASGVCSRWWFLTQDPNLWQNVDLSSSAGNVDDQLLLATKRFLRQTKHLRLCKSKITDISAGL